jgi:hypothetical protein
MSDNVTRLPVRKRAPDERSLKVIERWDKQGCQHGPKGNTYIVDEPEGTVECGLCHKSLNPLWVMLQLANEESYWIYHARDLRVLLTKYEARRRCKCRNCGKMTDIRL